MHPCPVEVYCKKADMSHPQKFLEVLVAPQGLLVVQDQQTFSLVAHVRLVFVIQALS